MLPIWTENPQHTSIINQHAADSQASPQVNCVLCGGFFFCFVFYTACRWDFIKSHLLCLYCNMLCVFSLQICSGKSTVYTHPMWTHPVGFQTVKQWTTCGLQSFFMYPCAGLMVTMYVMYLLKLLGIHPPQWQDILVKVDLIETHTACNSTVHLLLLHIEADILSYWTCIYSNFSWMYCDVFFMTRSWSYAT